MWNAGAHEDYLVFNKGKYVGVLTLELFNVMVNSMEGAYRGGVPNKEYEHAFIYNRKPVISGGNFANKRWWKPDGSPALPEDVPKEYIVMATLLA